MNCIKLLKSFVGFFVLPLLAVASFVVMPSSASAYANPAAVDLGVSGNFVILAKTAVTTTGTTAVTGNIGISPAAASFITGFSLVMDSSNTFSTSSLVTGNIYAADYTDPTPATTTAAVSAMEAAYTDAAGRITPDATELYSGNLGGRTLAPGLYKWSTDVTIPTDVTLSGGASDVWIFQISGDLSIASAKNVILSGGAKASNIFWQVGGPTGATLGTHSTFNGNILSAKQIIIQTGATLNGRALAQTQVTLDAGTVLISDTAPTPTGPVFIDTNVNGSLDLGESTFATIQAAVNAASTTVSQTVVVTAGTYAESVTVNKSVSITGVGITSVVSPATDQNGFNITANGVTIRNLKVALQTSGVDAQAIKITGANSVTVSGNTIETTGAKGIGIWVGGIGYSNSNNLTISNNTITITDASTGIYAEGGSTAQTGWSITGNTITANNGNPIELYDVTNSTVSGNTLTTTASGGSNVMWFSELASLSNLIFTNNVLSGSSGSEVAIGTDFRDTPLDTGNAFTGSITTVTVTGNTFSNWGSRALRIGKVNGTGTVTGVTVNNNKFLSAGEALRNLDTSSVDATSNWWGSAASTTVAGLIFGSVNYSPWYADAALTTFGATTVSDINGYPTVTLASAMASTTTTGAGTVSVNIPAGIVITGPMGWDGTLNLPVTITTTVAPTPDSGNTATTVGSIEVGFNDTLLTFDKAVKLTFTGQAGKYVGYSHGAGTFTKITTACTDNTQTTNDLLAAGSDCKIDVSGDLVVWTKHFSTFTTYTQTAIVVTPAPSTGGGGPMGLFGVVTNNSVGVQNAQAVVTQTPAFINAASPTPQGQVLGVSTYRFGLALGLGSRGNEVTELQNRLTSEGVYTGPVTGYFGSLTSQAVKAFQAKYGISQVGVVGPQTREKLNSGVGIGATNIPGCAVGNKFSTTTGETCPTVSAGSQFGAAVSAFARTLSQGSRGDDVTNLQNRLTAEGVYTGPITGYFGSLTKAAVMAYQEIKGIEKVGVVGPKTRAELNK